MGGASFQGFGVGDDIEVVLDKGDFRRGDLGEVSPLGNQKRRRPLACSTAPFSQEA